ncbi:hypothetical protein [Rufibacter aurantiacus]|uniref:hypothetical protein n=1 Tax=Rufibacter aurantiacus TaxID=2817374 RepID=UPI001B31862C|nr:hypothetical protein [Rufibacter aurantiacus]
MQTIKISVIAVLLLAAILIGLRLFGWESDKHNDLVINRIVATLEEFEANSKATKTRFNKLRLDSLTKFTWDSLYVFNNPWDSDDGEFTNELISKETGIKVTGKDICDRCTRLIFALRGEMVAYVDIDDEIPGLFIYRGRGASENSQLIPRSEATFYVYERCSGGQYLGFTFVPISEFKVIRNEVDNSCF